MFVSDAGQICSSCSAIELQEVCQHHIECNDNEVFILRFCDVLRDRGF